MPHIPLKEIDMIGCPECEVMWNQQHLGDLCWCCGSKGITVAKVVQDKDGNTFPPAIFYRRDGTALRFGMRSISDSG